MSQLKNLYPELKNNWNCQLPLLRFSQYHQLTPYFQSYLTVITRYVWSPKHYSDNWVEIFRSNWDSNPGHQRDSRVYCSFENEFFLLIFSRTVDLTQKNARGMALVRFGWIIKDLVFDVYATFECSWVYNKTSKWFHTQVRANVQKLSRHKQTYKQTNHLQNCLIKT